MSGLIRDCLSQCLHKINFFISSRLHWGQMCGRSGLIGNIYNSYSRTLSVNGGKWRCYRYCAGTVFKVISCPLTQLAVLAIAGSCSKQKHSGNVTILIIYLAVFEFTLNRQIDRQNMRLTVLSSMKRELPWKTYWKKIYIPNRLGIPGAVN